MKIMNDTEIQEYEHGLLKTVFEGLRLELTNMNLEEKFNKIINISIINDLSLNAHARKIESDKYQIYIRSGVIPIVFQKIAENVDLFTEKFGHLGEKESIVTFGCTIIWKHILGHEIGHITRGHNDFSINQNLFDLIDIQETLDFTLPENFDGDVNQFRMLMEFDADIYSSAFVTKQVLQLINALKNEGHPHAEKDMIKLACTSLILFFNFISEVELKTNKYPPAIVRVCTINSGLCTGLIGSIDLDEDAIRAAMNEAISETISFLVSDNYLNINGDKAFWDNASATESLLYKNRDQLLATIRPW